MDEDLPTSTKAVVRKKKEVETVRNGDSFGIRSASRATHHLDAVSADQKHLIVML